jgi:hypothetical protein
LENGDYEYRKIGIFNGMNEYHWMCVFMICAKQENKKMNDEEKKNEKNTKIEGKEKEKMENIRVLAISPEWAPLSSSPK